MLSIFIISIIIGILAQVEKGRTGVVWFFISIVIGLIMLYVISVVIATDPELSVNPDSKLGGHLTAGLVTFVIMGIIIMTLPNKKKNVDKKQSENSTKTNSINSVDESELLIELRKRGAITEGEYQKIKDRKLR